MEKVSVSLNGTPAFRSSAHPCPAETGRQEEDFMTETVTTLIAPDNHWALLTILFGSTFLAIWLEQKFK